MSGACWHQAHSRTWSKRYGARQKGLPQLVSQPSTAQGPACVHAESVHVTCVQLNKLNAQSCSSVLAAQCCCLCRSPSPLRRCACQALAGLVYTSALDSVGALHGPLTIIRPWLQIPITFAAVCLEVHHGEVQVTMEAPLDAEALVWRFPLQVSQVAGLCGGFGAAYSVIRVCVGLPLTVWQAAV